MYENSILKPAKQILRQRMTILNKSLTVYEAIELGVLKNAQIEQGVLVICNAGELYELNLIAGCVWDYIENGVTKISDIIKIISQTFNVETVDIQTDINELISFWISENLIISYNQ